MVKSVETTLAVIKFKIENLSKKCNDFITVKEFNSRISPLEKVVYGFISLVLVAVIGALLTTIIK